MQYSKLRAYEDMVITAVRENSTGAEYLDDDKYMELVEDEAFRIAESLTVSETGEVIRNVFLRTRCKIGLLQQYVEDPGINEIMVNGPESIFYEDRKGIHLTGSAFASVEELENVIRNIAADVHREINEMNPILDARLDDGSRVNAVYKNVAIGGPVLTIRKFSKDRITADEMVVNGTITEEAADCLKTLVRCGYNIFISGGTSSGKTTFLNALSDYIPRDERVIVIEDSRELQLSHIRNMVQMECRKENSLGRGGVEMDSLIRTSLRMRPNRIIVGEIRGREVADMLQAMNTGHDGSMSTGHGNSIKGMLRRIEAMYLMAVKIPMEAIKAQIVEGIDVMVHLRRLDSGRRSVVEIQELIGIDEELGYRLNPLFVLDECHNLVPTGNRLENRFKLWGRTGEELLYDGL